MALDAYSRIRKDDEVGRAVCCAETTTSALLIVSFKIACSVVAPPSATIAALRLSIQVASQSVSWTNGESSQ